MKVNKRKIYLQANISFVQTNMSRTVFHESAASLEDKKILRKKNGSTQFFLQHISRFSIRLNPLGKLTQMVIY